MKSARKILNYVLYIIVIADIIEYLLYAGHCLYTINSLKSHPSHQEVGIFIIAILHVRKLGLDLSPGHTPSK